MIPQHCLSPCHMVNDAPVYRKLSIHTVVCEKINNEHKLVATLFIGNLGQASLVTVGGQCLHTTVNWYSSPLPLWSVFKWLTFISRSFIPFQLFILGTWKVNVWSKSDYSIYINGQKYKQYVLFEGYTSPVHPCSKALLITTVLALGARRHTDVTVFVRLAHKWKPVSGVTQEKRLQQTTIAKITHCHRTSRGPAQTWQKCILSFSFYG